MISSLKAIVAALCLGLSSVTWAAVAIAVPFGPADNPALPTFTLLYENPQARATMIVVLGGEGRVGFNEKTKGTKTQTALMTTLLSDAAFSRNPINVAIFDSPAPLTPVHLRYGAEHLERIRSVISFYKAKFNHPIVLLGHSNGSTSVSEYVNKYAQSADVMGLIVSASKADLTLKPPLSIPTLFLHHLDDQCRLTPFFSANRNFERVKTINARYTEMAVVKGGDASGDPCRDGKHMYLGAYEEAARFVDEFVASQVLTR